MSKTLIGYARCSTDQQDLTAQRAALAELGVAANHIYVDDGLTGTSRTRPGLDQALAAVRKGDTLAVPEARPVGQVRSRCAPDRRRAHRPRRHARLGSQPIQPRRFHGKDDLQHSGDLCRIRGGSDPAAHTRRHGDRPSEGKVAWQEAQALRQAAAGAAAHTWDGEVLDQRPGGAVLGVAADGIPHARARL